MFNKIKNQMLFQGNLNSKNYFEGWNYKQVTADQKTSLSFIVGITLNKKDSHSFIQYILVEADENGTKQTKTGYIRFEVDEFSVEAEPFRIQISASTFTKEYIDIDIDLADQQVSFKGTIKLSDFYPIQQSIVEPNIMGPFAYIPFYVTEFEGFIANLIYKGKEYQFATYNRSTCTVQEISEKTVTVQLKNKLALLTLKAAISNTGQLIAP